MSWNGAHLRAAAIIAMRYMTGTRFDGAFLSTLVCVLFENRVERADHFVAADKMSALDNFSGSNPPSKRRPSRKKVGVD